MAFNVTGFGQEYGMRVRPIFFKERVDFIAYDSA